MKGQTHDAVFALLGQERLGKPRRLRWATSLQKSFGVDPLLDREGKRMRWARRVPPATAGADVSCGVGPGARQPAVFTNLKLMCCPRAREAAQRSPERQVCRDLPPQSRSWRERR